MLKVNGVMKEAERVKVDCPKDGVHRQKPQGYIKGCRTVLLGDKMIPRGTTGFYWQRDDKPDVGIKVFYSLSHRWGAKKKLVLKHLKRHKTLYSMGIANRPLGITYVTIDVKYIDDQGKKFKIKKDCFGIKVDHVHYPVEAWSKYAHGYPYDWNVLDQTEHPLHNPDGYKLFVEQVRAACLKSKVYVTGGFPVTEPDPPKLGDVVYCQVKKRWFLVDCG